MTCNIPDRVLKNIKAFARCHGIEKIVLFGSRSKGTHTERSDIDIAVTGGDFDAFYWDIKENAHTLLSFDVIDYRKASESLKEEIEKHGVTIYEKTR